MADSHSLAMDGTAVALDGAALLLTGPSGSGKSDLALRLIDAGAKLIADDRVELVLIDGRVHGRAPSDMPPNLRGRIEARGVGILPVPAADRPVPLEW
jgi:serine kinase of HPr protein (carbohydrate metabolism regulator)